MTIFAKVKYEYVGEFKMVLNIAFTNGALSMQFAEMWDIFKKSGLLKWSMRMSNEPLKTNRCTCFIITYQCKVSWMWNDKAAVYWKRYMYQHKNITVPQWSRRYTCSGPWWYTTVWPSHPPVTSCRLVVCTAILHSPPTQGLYNSLVYLLI